MKTLYTFNPSVLNVKSSLITRLKRDEPTVLSLLHFNLCSTATEMRVLWVLKEEKRATLDIWKSTKINKKCLTSVWTMLLIVTWLGLAHIFSIHLGTTMTMNFSKVKLKPDLKSWPCFKESKYWYICLQKRRDYFFHN